MKSFVQSVILMLVVSLLSVTFLFCIEASLLSLVYCGFFKSSSLVAVTGFLSSLGLRSPLQNTGPTALAVIAVLLQIVLTLAFFILLFAFFMSVLKILLKNEREVRQYYGVIFFIVLFLPLLLVLISVFCNIRLSLFTALIEVLLSALCVLLTIVWQKILPDTTDMRYRKFLYAKGKTYE